MRKPFFAFIVALFITTATFGFTATAFNGLLYTWPAAHAANALVNDGAGTLTWTGAVDTGVPTGLIIFYSGTSCPSGWAEFTWARGKYIVGLPASGTNWGAAGTALTNLESRPTGQHSHTTSESSVTVNETSHGHSVSGGTHSHANAGTTTSNSGDGGGSVYSASASADSTNAAASSHGVNNANANAGASATVTINNTSGTTAGTNAPYIQLLFCYKT